MLKWFVLNCSILTMAWSCIAMAPAYALNYTWNVASGSWNTSTNWLPNGTPGAGDNATIARPGGATVSIPIGVACTNLTLGGVASPQILSLTSSTTMLQVSGTVTIDSLGTLNVVSASMFQGTGSCTVLAGGTLAMSGGGISLPAVAIQPGGVLNLTGGGFSGTTINNSGATQWSTAGFGLSSASFNNLAAGSFSVTSPTLTLSTGGSATFSNAGLFAVAASSGVTTINSGITFSNSGTLVINASNTLVLNSLTNLSGGTLSPGTYLLSGSLQVPAGLGNIVTNMAQISFVANTGNISTPLGMNLLLALATNNGSITLTGGKNLTAAGSPFTNSGTLAVGPGSTFNAGAGNYIQTAGSTQLSGATLTAGGAVTIQGGTLLGDGAINASVSNAGVLGVTNGLTLNISGSFTQTAAGQFLAAIGGPAQIGVLAVAGTASLDGGVLASLSYTPALHDSLKIMTFASRAGQFAAVQPSALPGNLGLMQQANSSDVTLRVVSAASPSVLSASADNSTVAVNDPVTFTATASDPNGLPLTFTWDFMDGSSPGTGSSVTHAFSAEATYVVQLSVSNGEAAAAIFQVSVQVLGPNSGGKGVSNLANGVPNTNPLNGISVVLSKSDGGLCTFGVNVDALNRAAFNVSTDFNTLEGRSATVPGTKPVFKADNSGIYVATSSAADSTTGVVKGRGRKMIGMSGAEVGAAPLVGAAPKNHAIAKATTKGKFTFPKSSAATAGTPDLVTFGGTIELPAGLDLTPGSTQQFAFGIGNVFDAVSVTSKGTASGPSTKKLFKNLRISFPRLPKGTAKTPAGLFAKFQVSMTEVNMSADGFDTEGITNTLRADESSKKPVSRSIQVAMVLSGVVWQQTATVKFALSTKGNTGTMGGRSGL